MSSMQQLLSHQLQKLASVSKPSRDWRAADISRAEGPEYRKSNRFDADVRPDFVENVSTAAQAYRKQPEHFKEREAHRKALEDDAVKQRTRHRERRRRERASNESSWERRREQTILRSHQQRSKKGANAGRDWDESWSMILKHRKQKSKSGSGKLSRRAKASTAESKEAAAEKTSSVGEFHNDPNDPYHHDRKGGRFPSVQKSPSRVKRNDPSDCKDCRWRTCEKRMEEVIGKLKMEPPDPTSLLERLDKLLKRKQKLTREYRTTLQSHMSQEDQIFLAALTEARIQQEMDATPGHGSHGKTSYSAQRRSSGKKDREMVDVYAGHELPVQRKRLFHSSSTSSIGRDKRTPAERFKNFAQVFDGPLSKPMPRKGRKHKGHKGEDTAFDEMRSTDRLSQALSHYHVGPTIKQWRNPPSKMKRAATLAELHDDETFIRSLHISGQLKKKGVPLPVQEEDGPGAEEKEEKTPSA